MSDLLLTTIQSLIIISIKIIKAWIRIFIGFLMNVIVQLHFAYCSICEMVWNGNRELSFIPYLFYYYLFILREAQVISVKNILDRSIFFII